MKNINKIIIWASGLIIAIFIALSIFIALYGKKIVISSIEQKLKMKVSLGGISLTPPLTISLTDLEVGNLLKADRISGTANILGLFAGKLILGGLTVINPTLNLEQSADGSLNAPKPQAGAKEPLILLTALKIENGKLFFIDRKINSAGYTVIVDKINAGIHKVMNPLASKNIKFDISAIFVNPNGQTLGDASFSGWFDFGPKDMDANLQIKDLDIAYFAPYYGNFISKKKLLSAKLNLVSRFQAKNNDLAVRSNFRLSDLIYSKEEPVEEDKLPAFNLTRNTLDLFTDEKGNLELGFTINTKLDKPTISVDYLKKVILNAAVRNLSNQPPEKVIEKIHRTIEQFKELGKDIEDIFKKQDEKK